MTPNPHRVVVTRPGEPGERLVALLRESGCEVIHLPGMELAPVLDTGRAAADLSQRLDANLWVLTSANAVGFARELLGADWPARSGPGFAAPGEATTAALVASGVARERVVVPGAGHTSEALLREPELQQMTGRRVVILNAAGGRDLLQRELAARGAAVESVHVYRRVPPRLDTRTLQALAHGEGLTTVWTSATAMAELRASLPAACWRNLLAGRQIVPSARLEAEIRGHGAAAVVVASAPDNDALRQAVLGR